ncbi:MAG: chalcone isomerase family protein [Candidatus Aminicenantes bacterium]|nr:chalcone isomerase family protein [Candidatus Aminicenantes bacterium]
MKRLILTGLLLGFLVIPVSAAELRGVEMPDRITIAEQSMVLNGMALRKKVIFKVYVAGLYLPDKESDARKILSADSPRRTVMHFLRSVGAGKVNGAWYEGLEANTPGYSADLKQRFDKLAGFMEDVKSGDELVFTYLPGKGTEVTVKGSVKGTIEGKDFADALFACWIGEKPGPGEGFKNGLLGLEN